MKRREAQGCHGLGVFDKAVQTSLFRFAGVNQRGQDSNLSIHGNVLTRGHPLGRTVDSRIFQQ